MDELSHLDERGQARMVDVGAKEVTDRSATAEALITLSEGTRRALFAGELPKGDAIAVARVAAIQAAKRTSDLIPLCHPLGLSAIDVAIEDTGAAVLIRATVKTSDRTGVEMEALTAAAVGALTVYDMVKGIERGAEIGPVRLTHKSGGRSGAWNR